jgi:hypothetical protein
MGKRDARAVAEEIRRRAGLNGTHHAHHAAEDVPTGEEEPPPPKDRDRSKLRVATVLDLKKAGAGVKWLWGEGQCGWLADHVVCALAADAGLGKTRFVCDLVRRIKFGLPWPDGTAMTMPPAATAMFVMADNHHDQIVSISEAWDIEDRIVFNAWSHDPYEGTSLENGHDFKELDYRLQFAKPSLLVIDTVGNATDKNLSKAEDARAFYMPLQELARKRKCCIFALTHLSAAGKMYGRRGREKVRLNLHLEKPDPADDRLVLFVEKSGWRKPKPLGVTLTDKGYEYDDKPPKAPPMEPGQQGYGQQDGQQARRGPGRPPVKIVAAREWLAAQLADGPRRVSHLIDAGRPLDHSMGTLYRARDASGVEEYEDGDGRKWWRARPSLGAGEEEV